MYRCFGCFGCRNFLSKLPPRWLGPVRMTGKRITFGIDEKGNRLGEAHQRAKLSDADVELIRDIYDEGMESMAQIAVVFKVSKSLVNHIVNFRKRATTPDAYRTIDEAALKRPIPKSRLEQLGIDVEKDPLDEWDGNH